MAIKVSYDSLPPSFAIAATLTWSQSHLSCSVKSGIAIVSQGARTETDIKQLEGKTFRVIFATEDSLVVEEVK